MKLLTTDKMMIFVGLAKDHDLQLLLAEAVSESYLASLINTLPWILLNRKVSTRLYICFTDWCFKSSNSLLGY